MCSSFSLFSSSVVQKLDDAQRTELQVCETAAIIFDLTVLSFSLI
jgi:hypothetical protein